MSAFTGDLSKLGQLTRNLGRLASIPSRIATPAAEAIEAQIKDDYESSQDPYGNAWAELLDSTIKRKGGDSRIKIRSGVELGSISVRPSSGAGISISLSDYEGFHTGGTSHMVARPTLPTGTMPAAWKQTIDDVRDKLIVQAMGA